jgi:CheY-like chemotaxis protein
MADQIDILIAEDNPADLRLMEEALGELRPVPATHVVVDGEQVLEYLFEPKTLPPALLFLDFHLPKIESRDLLKRIREQQRFRETAVVVLTTSEVDEFISEAYRLGADCYLSKPSDLDAFLYTIRSAAEYWLNLRAHQSPGDVSGICYDSGA